MKARVIESMTTNQGRRYRTRRGELGITTASMKLLLMEALLVMTLVNTASANTGSTTFVIREQAGVFVPAGRCNSLSYRELQARLHALFQRIPRVDIDGSTVTMQLKPLAVIDRTNKEKLLSGGGFSADQVIERRATYPTVIARFIGSSMTIEIGLEMATSSSLRVDFATAHVAFTDLDGCTAKWVGVSVRSLKETK